MATTEQATTSPASSAASGIEIRDERVVRRGVGRPLGVSDHWPVWAELDLDRKDETQA